MVTRSRMGLANRIRFALLWIYQHVRRPKVWCPHCKEWTK